MRVEAFKIRRAGFPESRDLGVRGRAREINGTGMRGFGVARPSRACGVLGLVLGQVDVSVGSSSSGRRHGTCDIDDAALELAAELVVEFNAGDGRDNGFQQGVFGGVTRGDVGA